MIKWTRYFGNIVHKCLRIHYLQSVVCPKGLDKANYNKAFHDKKEVFNKDCEGASDFVTSESGRVVKDMTSNDIT